MRFCFTTLSLLLVAPIAYADVRDDIFRTCENIQTEVYRTEAGADTLRSAYNSLFDVLDSLEHGGGGNAGEDVYCRRIRNTVYYAPARVSDQEWLQENGTDLAICQSQLGAARFGLLCAKVRNTDFYSPMLIAEEAWRGENGTDIDTCFKQTRNARRTIFCQRIRNTDYYAIARISTGEWMQENGTSIDECLAALGTGASSLESNKAVTREPAIPAPQSPQSSTVQ